MNRTEPYDLDIIRFNHRGKDQDVIRIRADHVSTERIIPPAGEDYAWDLERWRHNVEVSVSPTGRSVQIYVNGAKVYP